MITITIKDLIPIIPDLLNVFLSGFIYMTTYNWLNNKKNDISFMTIWSIFISILIQSFYSVLHLFVLNNIPINTPIKVIVYSLTGLILAIIITKAKKSELLSSLIYKINNKSINDDIFTNIIDYDKKTMMKIYIKSSDVYYIGRFSFIEENGYYSWISLIDYYCVDKKRNKKTFDPQADELLSSVTINLSSIERIELMYEPDSTTWTNLNRIDK